MKNKVFDKSKFDLNQLKKMVQKSFFACSNV